MLCKGMGAPSSTSSLSGFPVGLQACPSSISVSVSRICITRDSVCDPSVIVPLATGGQ